MLTSALRAEVVIWPFPACLMHPAIITGTVRSLLNVDVAMGQIPRSTERISSLHMNPVNVVVISDRAPPRRDSGTPAPLNLRSLWENIYRRTNMRRRNLLPTMVISCRRLDSAALRCGSSFYRVCLT